MSYRTVILGILRCRKSAIGNRQKYVQVNLMGFISCLDIAKLMAVFLHFADVGFGDTDTISNSAQSPSVALDHECLD